MKTVRVKIYKFNELSEAAKNQAIKELSDINTVYNWWDFIYADAADIGLEITSFDTDRGLCEGNLNDSLAECCEKIIANHGEQTETYKTAKAYLAEWAQLVAEHSDGIHTDKVAEGKENEFDQLADEQEQQFKRSLLKNYLNLLRREYDYITSDAAIIESIISNDYDFTSNGNFWNVK